MLLGKTLTVEHLNPRGTGEHGALAVRRSEYTKLNAGQRNQHRVLSDPLCTQSRKKGNFIGS